MTKNFKITDPRGPGPNKEIR